MDKKTLVSRFRVGLGVCLIIAFTFCQTPQVSAAPRHRPGPAPRYYHHVDRHYDRGADALGIFATILAIGIIASSVPERHETVVVKSDSDQGFHKVYPSPEIVIPVSIMNKAVNEAVDKDATIKFAKTTEENGEEVVIATPQGQDGGYKLINVKYTRDGKVIKEEVRRIPTGENE